MTLQGDLDVHTSPNPPPSSPGRTRWPGEGTSFFFLQSTGKRKYDTPGRPHEAENEVLGPHEAITEADEVPLEEQGGYPLATRPNKSRRTATRTALRPYN